MGYFASIIAGLFIVLGVIIVRAAKNTDSMEELSMSMAFGAMLGLAVFDILPEAVEHCGSGKWYLILIGCAAGFLLLTLLDGLILAHDHAGKTKMPNGTTCDFAAGHTTEAMSHIGVVASFAIILHNIIEGMAIYGVADESPAAGLLMSLSVGLHNIPMGMMLYTTLRNEKRSKRCLLLFYAAISTFIGSLLMSALWRDLGESWTGLLMSVALGMVIYILIRELFPHLRYHRSPRSYAAIVLGLAIVVIASRFH